MLFFKLRKRISKKGKGLLGDLGKTVKYQKKQAKAVGNDVIFDSQVKVVIFVDKKYSNSWPNAK
jgi:hypothetical protein